MPASGGTWHAAGSRAALTLDRRALGPPLTAGWYVLRGRFGALQVEDGGIALPSVCLRYVGHSAMTDVELMLPEPGKSGRFAALLMFLDDVQSLEFHPGLYPARFRTRDFSLSRVSRLQALRTMLAGPARMRQTARAKRLWSWGRAVASRGLKHATDRLYADYRSRIWPQGLGEYDVWTFKYDTFDRAGLDALRQRARAVAGRAPLISVLMSVRDAHGPSLRRCLDSVLAQSWERWELCAVDGAPDGSAVADLLDEYAGRDPRIRVTRSRCDDDAADSCNAALSAARGEFVTLLGCEDELAPHALLRLAESAVADPECGIVYSDEDQIAADGKRFDPKLKPDWNPDLLYSGNYVGRLAAVPATLARETGGFRAGFEDEREYDLLLRCIERVTPQQIHHVPEILYHRRSGAGFASTRRDVVDRAADAGARAVAEHLRRIGSPAKIGTSALPRGLHRIHWPLPQPVPRISLLIPTRNRVDLLRRCVESILAKTTYPDFELLVIDNQSDDGAAMDYLRRLATHERVRVLRYDKPFNYSAINNWAARECTGELLGLVNNDIEVISPDWLEEMAGFAVRPDTGVVGAMLYYPDDTIQHAGMLLGIHGVAGHAYAGMPRGYRGYMARALVAQEVSAVTGACLLVRREVYAAVGGLDERLPVEFNDVDFCLRVRQRGYRNVWTPFAELYHHESASRAIDDAAAKQARSAGIACMLERWGEALREDPAYNPNLSLQSLNFELAFPPRGRMSNPQGERTQES